MPSDEHGEGSIVPAPEGAAGMKDIEVTRLEEASKADMADTRRVGIGGIVTVAYLVAIFVWWHIQGWHLADLEPNELGDFLAGTFAPVAFLWLVLGFFQQGAELRNSTRALLVQAKELRSSVEQQRDLVRVTNEQLAHEKEQVKAAEEEAVRLAQPRFRLRKTGSSSAGGGEMDYGLALINAGAPCTDVRIVYKDEDRAIFLPSLATGQRHNLTLRLTPDEFDGLELVIAYFDARGVAQNEYITP